MILGTASKLALLMMTAAVLSIVAGCTKDGSSSHTATPEELKTQNDANKKRILDERFSKDHRFVTLEDSSVAEEGEKAWEKVTLEIRTTGEYRLTSQIGDLPEEIYEGKWERVEDSEALFTDFKLENLGTGGFLTKETDGTLCVLIHVKGATGPARGATVCEQGDQE